jgi:hypothetical protein
MVLVAECRMWSTITPHLWRLKNNVLRHACTDERRSWIANVICSVKLINLAQNINAEIGKPNAHFQPIIAPAKADELSFTVTVVTIDQYAHETI